MNDDDYYVGDGDNLNFISSSLAFRCTRCDRLTWIGYLEGRPGNRRCPNCRTTLEKSNRNEGSGSSDDHA